MDERIRGVLAHLAAGEVPPAVPEGVEYGAELRALCACHAGLLAFCSALADGNLSVSLRNVTGPLAGSLTALQTNLRSLAGQARQIADGNLDRRIDPLGEQSEAVNLMAESLEADGGGLLRLSTHDPLTGCYNRGYFDAELARLCRGRTVPVSIIMADVDGLKGVNDSRGHGAGDALILRAAAIMTRAVRGDDIVARIGGDQFAVVMPGCDEGTAAAALERIRQLARLEGEEVPLSLGVATAATADGIPAARRRADQEMCRDKTSRTSGSP
jgi:diguanylate cyclase (GGDEF)-like protein